MSLTRIPNPHFRGDILGLLADCIELRRLNPELALKYEERDWSKFEPPATPELLEYAREYWRLNKMASDAACR